MAEPDFSHRHPDYARMCRRWEMAWDFWRGGVHVLSPDHEATEVRFAQVVKQTASDVDSTSAELGRHESDYEWTTSYARSYLWKHTSEGRQRYEERCARQIHFPLFKQVVNIFVAGILRTSVDRGKMAEEIWQTYHSDVDLRGTSVDAFIRQALAMALIFGRVHAITDRPSSTAPVTRQDQLDRGERTYSYLVTPLDLVDWRLDEFGRFDWATVREMQPEVRAPGQEAKEISFQYRVWYPDGWELWRAEGDPGTGMIHSAPRYYIDSGAAHNIGEVPISTLWASEENQPASMSCESPLADILDIDREVLNRLSELDELERMQSFSILWVPELEGTPGGPIDMGPHSGITGDSAAGAPQYISPDASHAIGKWNRIADKLHVARQYAGVGRGRSEYSKEERSAAALSVESVEKQNQMSIWAASTEEFDRKLHRHVALLEGADPTKYKAPEYPRNFDLKGLQAQISELVQLSALKPIGPKPIAAMAKPLIARKLKENGVDDSDIKQILADVDEWADKPPELQDVPERTVSEKSEPGQGPIVAEEPQQPDAQG